MNLRERNERLWQRFHDPKTHIVNKGKWYAIAPLVIIFIGAILLMIPQVGFNLGLDFTGGSGVTVSGLHEDNIAAVKTDVTNILDGYGLKYNPPLSGEQDGGLTLSVTYARRGNVDMEAVFTDISDLEAEHSINVERVSEIGATATGDRILMTFISVAVSLVAIMIYMLFRFKFTSGLSALIALFHDVLVMCALTVIFRIEVNYSFVAAIITVVVYSLNNTLVIFDRVRDTEKQIELKMTPEQIMDKSIKETFSRTMGTTITTLVAVLGLVIVGVSAIRDFALPIFFGLVAGTFSTLWVATSLYVRFETARKIKKNQKEKFKRQENLVSAE